MASTAREIFLIGLRNAHAMETQARELMERQSERLTGYPEVQARMKTHLRETEGQLEEAGSMPVVSRGKRFRDQGHRSVRHGEHDGNGSFGRRR